MWLLPSTFFVQDLELTQGVTLSNSVKVAKREYKLANTDDTAKSGVITLKGNDMVVDFNGATLLGSDWETAPDKRTGTAVIVEGRNITIRNLNAHGYKVALIARNSDGLKLENCDFSYNWKQRLGSTLDKEDSGDWMSYHKNEGDEWLRYGAGIYLRNTNNFEVKNCRIVGGANGLMISECNNGKIWNNSFSFLSAIGLGMYRSSNNKVMHNNIDWCVRGYSHTKWNRGQDSSGILIYEQSNKNTFAYNSVTHGGDGFFLWAGQTTMDTGKGGCNDNLLYGNDFSHAPTNGIEATFSRNKFVNNLVMECWHGIWGGYSFDSETVGNVFAYNGEAIAWEHGQKNRVVNNLFYRDTMGINIWMNKSQDPNWEYPKTKDTASKDWIFRANEFNQTAGDAFRIRDTANVEISRNYISSVGKFIRSEGANPGLAAKSNWLWLLSKDHLGSFPDNTVTYEKSNSPVPGFLRPDGNNIESPWVSTQEYLDRFDLTWAPYPKDPMPSRGMENDPFLKESYRASRTFAPTPLEGGKRPYIKAGQLRGRRYILVDEWGPYDFKSPIIWPRTEIAGKTRFEILGPKGQWKVVSKSGVTAMSKESGSTQETVDVTFDSGSSDIDLQLEFVGDAIVTPFGKKIPANTPYRFSYKKFNAPIDWNVSFYTWDKDSVGDPISAMPALAEMKLGEPVKTLTTKNLNFGSGSSFVEGAPADYFATIAEGTLRISPGEYTLNVTADDGVRVWVDDKLVIRDGWKHQVPTQYQANLTLRGSHKIRVEHYEINGYATLKVDLAKR